MGEQSAGVEEEAVAFDEADQPWAVDEPSILEDIDEEAEARADAEAEEDARAGRVISHAAVSRWLLSLGSGDPLPRPQPGD